MSQRCEKKLAGDARRPMTERHFERAVRLLCERDADLGRIVERHGRPHLRSREPGFGTLLYIILEQQVSLASARATWRRLHSRLGRVTPRRLLRLGAAELRGAGLSRQKAIYATELARASERGRLDLGAVARLPDDDARRELLRIKGIGPWTADIYLLSALGRPDVWPLGDLALAVAVREVKRLRQGEPSRVTLERIAEPWRPWRAAAARLLWHHYLSERGRVP